jgi:hypothetical protein
MVDVTSKWDVKIQAGGTKVDILGKQTTNLPSDEIDAVYIRPNGNGTRCLYTFSDYSGSAIGLESGGSTFTASSVVVCADGVGTPPPPEPEIIEPISTAADGCQGQISDGANAIPGFTVYTAVSQEGNQVAVCSTTDQFQCVNICKNFQGRAETPECAAASVGLTDGQLDLNACRPCDLTDLSDPPAVDRDGNALFYCWEYTNSVVRDPPLSATSYPNAPGTENVPGTEVPRAPGTLLPHKPAWSNTQEIQAYNPCTTTTTWLNGRQYTYTTCK